MRTTTAQPAAVLDYAAPTAHDAVLRRLRAAVLVLSCTALSGGLGWLLDPRMHRAVAYLQIDVTQQGTDQLLDASAVQSQQAAAATGVAAPANLKAAAALLPPTMPLTPAEISPKLKVQTIPASRLVSVRFDHRDARTSAAVVNAVISAYTAPQVMVVVTAMPPARPQRNHLYPLAGVAAGLLGGLFIVATRRQ